MIRDDVHKIAAQGGPLAAIVHDKLKELAAAGLLENDENGAALMVTMPLGAVLRMNDELKEGELHLAASNLIDYFEGKGLPPAAGIQTMLTVALSQMVGAYANGSITEL